MKNKKLSRASGSKLPPGVTYENETAALIAGVRKGVEGEWETGFHWNRLTHGDLLHARRLTPRKYLEKELIPLGFEAPSLGELNRRGTVAAIVPQEPAVRFGSMERLYLGIVNCRHAGKPFNAEDPAATEISIPQPDSSFRLTRLAACSKKALEEANSRFGVNGKPTLSDRDRAIETVVQAALSKMVGSDGQEAFHLARKQDGLYFSLSIHAPMGRLSAIVEALKGSL